MPTLNEDFWKTNDPKTTTRLTLRISKWPEQLWKYDRLEWLSIYRSEVDHLPPQISKLQSLKHLNLGQSQIRELPDELCELTNLESLDINYLDLKELPENIGNLKNLRKLDLYYNLIGDFPESMHKLTQLEDLRLEKVNRHTKKVMDFPVCFLGMDAWVSKDWKPLDGQGAIRKLGKTKQFAKLLKKCIDLGIGYEGRRAFYYLYYNVTDRLPEEDWPWVLQALSLSDSQLQDAAFKHIFKHQPTLKDKPLGSGSEILLLGKLKTLKEKEIKPQLKEQGITLSKKISKTTSHVVLTTNIKNLQDIHQQAQLAFLKEDELKNFLEQDDENLYLKEEGEESAERQENIKKLLLSRDPENVNLALELIKTGGFPTSLKNEMFLAYQSNEDKKLRKQIKEIMKVYLSEKGKKALVHFNFHPNGDGEEYFTRRVRKHLHDSPDFDAVYIVNFLYEHYKQGCQYMIKHAAESDAIEFLGSQMIRDGVLDLEDLWSEEIKPMWKFLKHFPNLTTIAFDGESMVPKALMEILDELPNLSTFDFRRYPQHFRPSTEEREQLKNYTILT